MLNPAKTDLLWCTTNGCPPDVSVSACGVNVWPSTDVRNRGILFDVTLSLKTHVTQVVGRCYGWLRWIRSCRRALSQSAAITLISSCIIPRTNYCNSLLGGCRQQQIDKLQRIMNCAARVVYNCSRRDHVTPLLRDNIHWLRVRERILFTNWFVSFTLVSCSWHSVRPAHLSGAQHACVHRCSPSCLE